jgi:hypothetical protein
MPDWTVWSGMRVGRTMGRPRRSPTSQLPTPTPSRKPTRLFEVPHMTPFNFVPEVPAERPPLVKEVM